MGPEGHSEKQAVVLEERVEPAETEAEEDARGERAAAFAGHQDVGAGGAFGVDAGCSCSSTMSWRRSGIMNSTPSHPPKSASAKMRVDSRSKPRKMSAGRVKMTPEAIDWPALPMVWTMLFSRMDALPKRAQNRDGQHGDGDGRGDGEAGAQSDVDRDGSEENGEDAAEDDGAEGELGRVSEAGTKGWNGACAAMGGGFDP